MSRVHERYRQTTDDRQTNRQTDGPFTKNRTTDVNSISNKLSGNY